MHLVGRLRAGVDDRAIARAAAAAGVEAPALSSYYQGPAAARGLLLGYAGVDGRAVERAAAAPRRGSMTSKGKPPMTRPIANITDIALERRGNGQGFVADVGAIGPTIGAQKLGCSLVVVPPGKKAWPYHLQYANEEMFVILEGAGTLRYDGGRYPIRAGDVIASPVSKAHQILNTSDAELRYLAISTMIEPDIAEYPDSRKRAMIAGAPPGRRPYPLYVIVSNDAEARLLPGRGVAQPSLLPPRCPRLLRPRPRARTPWGALSGGGRTDSHHPTWLLLAR